VGPSVQLGKRKNKRGRLGFWAKRGAGPAHGPTRLGLGFVVSSACGSAGRLGPRAGWHVGWLTYPAGVGFEFTRWLRLGPCCSLGRGGLAASSLLLSVLLTGRSHMSASAGSGVAGPGSGAAGRCACVRVGAVARVCVCLEGARGKAPEA
jgi:hypothetical protein